MADTEEPQDVEMADVSEKGDDAKPEDSIAAMKAKVSDSVQNNGSENNTNGDSHDSQDSRDSRDSQESRDSRDNRDSDNDEIEEVERVNGNPEGKSQQQQEEDELSIDDEEMAEEEEEIEELDSSDDSDTPRIENGNSSQHQDKINRRKMEMKMRDIEEIGDSDDDDDENDVEEVKEDDSGSDGSSDSDIMEVEAEDPLGGGGASVSQVQKKPTNKTPNVVTIDDVRTLHKIANANRQPEPDKPVVIDTSTILAGKATSGVTITPARPKSNSSSPSLHNVPSGVTISSSRGPSVPLRGSGGAASNITGKSSSSTSSNTAFGYDSKGQLNDPNLTDDTFVVEAPSFIVPYVYEKPPKETFEDFKADLKKVIAKKEKEEKEKKEKEEDKDEDSNDSKKDDEEKEKEEEKDEEEKKKDEEDIVEVNKEQEQEEPKKKNYFDSSLGKFLFDLGMNLVQESVQADLLKTQIRRSQKDKSAAVMHAIMSLKKNLETSKDHNEPFHIKEIKCRFCSFRTTSELVMQHHMETPHMKHMFYRCNYCRYDTKLPQEVLQHMLDVHGVRGRLERAPGMHQCPQCPFEDNMKGKLTRHKNSCDKRFRPERNQEPPLDWEPPAKIPKPNMMNRRPGSMGYPMGAAQQLSQLANMRNNPVPSKYSGMPSLQMGQRGRGRPVFGGSKVPSHFSMNRQGGSMMNSFNAFNRASSQMLGKNIMANHSVMQAMNQSRFGANKMLSNLGSNSSVTIQSVSQRNANSRGNNSPSISITPLPGKQGGASAGVMRNRAVNAMKPGQPSASAQSNAGGGGGKGSFVICEICDGYIKDLEQLRNHMLWIHKVKIHPKMIYNRPPLNCQKCQFRFFTDQGLERHLLGSHGLVTASMQELANKGQDSGRCPVCGKVYQWKLLNHVAKDHQKTLKPAHLSYKCTVCTATFGQYKLFETHVYQAHSGNAKKGGNADKSKVAAGKSTNSPRPTMMKLPLPADISVIPKSSQKKTPSQPAASKKASSDEVIELDDEEEINDVEEETPKSKPSAGGADSGEEEGVEEIEDDEPEED